MIDMTHYRNDRWAGELITCNRIIFLGNQFTFCISGFRSFCIMTKLFHHQDLKIMFFEMLQV